MIQILLFAGAREIVGSDRIALDWPRPAPVSELRGLLGKKYPALSPFLPSSLFSRSTLYLTPDALIAPGDELAMIPAVSGG